MITMFKQCLVLGVGLVVFQSSIIAQNGPNALMSMQKEILSKLTGKSPIKDTIYLKQRSTSKERELTVAYLSEFLEDMGWNMENHHYSVTNGNPFLDMFFSPMTGINVAAVLPATTDSSEYVLFGSHYDTERGSPGAIDNGTGIAISLAIASKLVKLKKRNINFLIVFFDQEEDNEVGSRAYAKLLRESGRKVHSVHTLDMIGWDGDKNNGLELELPSPYLENLYKNEAQKHNVPLYTTKLSSSDHKSFIDQGFDALGISEEYVKRDTTPYYHTPKDDYDTVDFDFLVSSTQFLYAIMHKISNEPNDKK